MSRAFLFVMDSVGIGGAPDAARFGDAGANTLGHISDQMKLNIPNLISLGIAKALNAASGSAHGLDFDAPVKDGWGFATQVSQGKDTITGHWEMGGIPLNFKWGYFPQTVPAFPLNLINEIIARAKIPGLLCLAHASGTQVIEDFGPQIFAHATFLFLLLLIREMIKDLENIKGDIANDYQTIPVQFGAAFSKRIITLLTVATIIPIYFLIEIFEVGYMDIYFYISMIVLIFFLQKLWKSNTQLDYLKLHNILKVLVVAGVFCIVLINPEVLIHGKKLLKL